MKTSPGVDFAGWNVDFSFLGEKNVEPIAAENIRNLVDIFLIYLAQFRILADC